MVIICLLVFLISLYIPLANGMEERQKAEALLFRELLIDKPLTQLHFDAIIQLKKLSVLLAPKPKSEAKLQRYLQEKVYFPSGTMTDRGIILVFTQLKSQNSTPEYKSYTDLGLDSVLITPWGNIILWKIQCDVSFLQYKSIRCSFIDPSQSPDCTFSPPRITQESKNFISYFYHIDAIDNLCLPRARRVVIGQESDESISEQCRERYEMWPVLQDKYRKITDLTSSKD